jgi:hypothetical protein
MSIAAHDKAFSPRTASNPATQPDKRTCLHGVREAATIGRCFDCWGEELASIARQRAEVALREQSIRLQRDRDALRSGELHRLGKIVADIDGLRTLDPKVFEDRVAALFNLMGFKVEQTPFAADGGRDAVMTKNGRKYLLECKRRALGCQAGRPDIQKFHSALVTDRAAGGFFVSTGGFTQPAREYAKTISSGPMAMVLVGSRWLQRMLTLLENGGNDSYQTKCTQCGSTASHHARLPRNALCKSGHVVHPSITIEDVLAVAAAPYACAKCKNEMCVIRGHQGLFWGCYSYPDCRNTKAYDPGNTAV